MRKRFGTSLLLAMLVCILAFSATAAAQGAYVAPPVKVSKDKVRVGGKVYYSHVVTEKQTLWSISKAYEVELQDIYDANPTLNLPVEGLKTGQILMIPTRRTLAREAASRGSAPAPAEDAPVVPESPQLPPAKPQEVPPAMPSQPAVQPDAVPNAPADSLAAPADTLTAPSDSVAPFILDIPERIGLSVVLPFGSALSRNEGNLAFCSGALLAARDLGNKGIKLDISVCDLSDSLRSGIDASVSEADVILGPVFPKDILKVLESVPDNGRLVSPLDPKGAALADSCRIVQAPTPWQDQIRDLVAWAAEEMQPGDSLVLVAEQDVALSEASAFLSEELRRSGLRFTTIKYGILQGLTMTETFENNLSKEGTTRYFIASDNEAFVGDVIRIANLMTFKEHPVTVYCPSRVRAFELIDVETFHNVSLRMSTTYFTDYTDPAVKAFVMAYRALFRTEPDSYAFQGYDTATYFATLCSLYGRNWFQKLPEYRCKGLHTDFRFEPASGKGQVNRGVRRVVFNPDFSVKLL